MPKGKPIIKKRKHRPAMAIKDSYPAKSDLVGSDLRMAAFVKRAVELKQRKYPHHVISQMIQKEFHLESRPAINTIAYWLGKSYGDMIEGIKELQHQARMDDLEKVDELLEKWIVVAGAQKLEIQRWKIISGTLQPVLDANGFEEQIKATHAVVKLLERKARLLGYDLADAIDEKGKGPATLQELQIWMVRKMAERPAIETEGRPVLELRSGLEEELAEIMKEPEDSNGV